MKHTITVLLTLIFFCFPVSAKWYAGAGLHGLQFDQEKDGNLKTNFFFQGPRGFVGWRINDNFRAEAEVGLAEFQGKLYSDVLDADLEMVNVAVTGLYYLPVNFLVKPFVYAGFGPSYWNYKVLSFYNPEGYSDSSSDLYWHYGVGGEIVVSKNLRVRIGYRHWQVEIHPAEGQWAVAPDRYSYERGGLDVSFYWMF